MVSAMAIRTMARRQRAVKASLRCFANAIAILWEPRRCLGVEVSIPAFVRRAQSMRWKIDHQGHLDPRFSDLLAVLVLIVLIVAAWMFFRSDTSGPNNTGLIVPSQSVRW
jgi:hypothetical protein